MEVVVILLAFIVIFGAPMLPKAIRGAARRLRSITRRSREEGRLPSRR